MHKYYMVPGDILYYLRQTRFLPDACHPHDIIAVGSPEQLRGMADEFDLDVDWRGHWDTEDKTND